RWCPEGLGRGGGVGGSRPGGKTGTAEKVGKHGYKRGFKENFNVAAFTSVFPMNAPRYAVYMMLDEPHGNKSTYGYSTAGWVAAPETGRVIARIGPMLGMLPDTQDAPAINQALSIPLEPGRPPGAVARGPGAADAKLAPTWPVTALPPARPVASQSQKREAVLVPARSDSLASR